MLPALDDFNLIVLDSIDEPVGFVYAAAEPTSVAIFQRFWLADASEDSIPFNTEDQLVYFPERLSVFFLPFQIIVPGFVIPYFTHRLNHAPCLRHVPCAGWQHPDAYGFLRCRSGLELIP